MTEVDVRVLQIGQEDWSQKYDIPENIEWSYGLPDNYRPLLFDEKGKKVRPFSLILFTDETTYEESFDDLFYFATPYSVFYNQNLGDWEAQKALFISRVAKPMDMSNPEHLIPQLGHDFFSGQEGAKADNRYVNIYEDFKGKVSYQGNTFIHLEGDFGQDFKPLLTWRYNIASRPGQTLDFWLEYLKEGEVNLLLKAYRFIGGSSDLDDSYTFTEIDMEKQVTIPSKEKEHYLSFVLYAKGNGTLKLGPLHQRRARNAYGEYIAGGQRLVVDKRQELIAYFSPGDLKPPLNVYFSGYRTAEGFEGYWMMSKMKSPFILIGDPRLEGGSFYMGSEQLENQVTDFIEDKLQYLGFNKKQMILSGLSMGTFGASYYASRLEPHAVIIGKPLFSLGTIAKNGFQIRPDEFGTAFDMVHSLTNQLTKESMEEVNQKFWKAIEKADFSKTLFAMAYMKHDDYDNNAYYDFLDWSQGKNIKVISKGIEGRHNDNSASINQWFLNQYTRIMSLDFGRKS